MAEIAVLENCKEILPRSSCEKKVPVDYFEKNLRARTLLFFFSFSHTLVIRT